MRKQDFNTFKITHIGPSAITQTGADLNDVSILTVQGLEKMCIDLDYDLLLLKNGLTSGNHISPYHPDGTAADVFAGILGPHVVFQSAIRAGFRGFGYYINEKGIRSYHVDLRPDFTPWKKVKKSGNWVYAPFIV